MPMQKQSQDHNLHGAGKPVTKKKKTKRKISCSHPIKEIYFLVRWPRHIKDSSKDFFAQVLCSIHPFEEGKFRDYEIMFQGE